MELVLLCLSLLVHHGFTQEACRCLDPSLCGDPAGCGYRCQAGFAGLNCREVNHGFNLAPDAPELFDGDFSTCREYTGRITFSHPIDIDKIRIHRENKNTGTFYALLYKSSTRVITNSLPQYKRSTEGEAVAASFPLQTGVTAIRIGTMRTACEVELSDAGPKQPEKTTPAPKPTPTPAPTPRPSKAITCPANPCNGRGTCQIEGNRPVCRCDDGYRGDRCESKCERGRYGNGCTQECATSCKRETCHHVDGSCDGKRGWTGDQCTNNDNLTTVYLLVGVISVLIVGLAVAFIVILRQRQTLLAERKRTYETPRPADGNKEEHEYNQVLDLNTVQGPIYANDGESFEIT